MVTPKTCAYKNKMEPLVFLDTETTGLEPGYHEIIEICAAKLPHKIASTIEYPERQIMYYLTLPLHKERIDLKAALINGFNMDNWLARGAVELHEVIEPIARFMDGCTIVGFNPWFDLRFIIASTPSDIDLKFNYHTIDLCSMAYPLKVAGKIPGVSAKHICKFFEIDYSRAHRACEDVDLSIDCYRLLLNYYENLGQDQLRTQ